MNTADRFRTEALVEVDSDPDVPKGTVWIYDKLTSELIYSGPMRGRVRGNGGCLMVFNPEDYEDLLAYMTNNGVDPISIN